MGGGQDVPDKTRRGKKLIQLQDITYWVYSDLPCRGILLRTPGMASGIPLNLASFHHFTM